MKKDQIFIGDICTQYKNGNTTVDVKVDTYSKVSREDFVTRPFGLFPTVFSWCIFCMLHEVNCTSTYLSLVVCRYLQK